MTALSLDLRRRILQKYEMTPGATYDSVAAQFLVGRASVNRLLRLKRETGDVVLPTREKKPRFRISLDWLKGEAEKFPDATLEQRSAKYLKETGIYVGYASVWGALKHLGFSHKKRRFSRKSERRSEFKSSAKNSQALSKVSRVAD